MPTDRCKGSLSFSHPVWCLFLAASAQPGTWHWGLPLLTQQALRSPVSSSSQPRGAHPSREQQSLPPPSPQSHGCPSFPPGRCTRLLAGAGITWSPVTLLLPCSLQPLTLLLAPCWHPSREAGVPCCSHLAW